MIETVEKPNQHKEDCSFEIPHTRNWYATFRNKCPECHNDITEFKMEDVPEVEMGLQPKTDSMNI